jgi:hypothetical protein
MAEELARRAAVLKDVLFETTFELDRFEAALLRGRPTWRSSKRFPASTTTGRS